MKQISNMEKLVHSMEGNFTNQSFNQSVNLDLMQFRQLGYFFSLGVNLMMILVGNLALLIFIGTRSKSRMHKFILNLAVADLCVGIFVVLPQFVEMILMQFYGPEILCRFKWFFTTLIAYSASYALVALSIDRVDAIANPMKTSTTKSSIQTAVLITGNWVLSALFATPLWFWTKVQNHPQYGRQCTIWLGSSGNDSSTQTTWKIYFTVNMVTVIVIPVIVVALCHIGLIVVIFRASRGPGEPRQSISTASKKAAYLQGKRESNVCGRRSITKAKVKTVQITFTIVTVFIICWSPFAIGNFLELYHVLKMKTHIRILIQTMGTLNSAVNPIIFFLFNHKLCRNNNNSNNRGRSTRLRIQGDRETTQHQHHRGKLLKDRESTVTGVSLIKAQVVKNGTLRESNKNSLTCNEIEDRHTSIALTDVGSQDSESDEELNDTCKATATTNC